MDKRRDPFLIDPRHVANPGSPRRGLMSQEQAIKLAGYPEPANLRAEVFAIPAFKVRHSLAQAIVNGGAGTLGVFDTGSFDTHSGFAASIYTIPAGWGGIWRFGATGEFVANAAGMRQVRIFVAGAMVDYRGHAAVGATYPMALGIETLYAVTAGQQIRAGYYQDSGGALNIGATSPYTPGFWGHWVRPAP